MGKRKALPPLAQQIFEIIAYWQPKLRLDNWKFSFKIHDDVKDIECFALNKQDPNYEIATIEVLDPSKIPESWKGCRDIEVTILHELLHTRLLYVAPLPEKKKEKGKKANWQVEMAVETISRAMVAAKRGIEPEDIK
jgi:hypothetical protein